MSNTRAATISVSDAARLLGLTEAQLRYQIRKGMLRTDDTKPGGRGLAVVEDDVRDARRKLLASLGAAEPCRRCAVGGDAAGDVSVAALQAEVHRLSEVARLGLVIEAARADQLRVLLPAESLHD